MKPNESSYRVKQVAELTGVSVRTLHYYDEIGLLVPARTRSGYRSYGDAQLLRLQQILIGRQLGLALEDIRRSLDDPKFDHRAALLEQRKLLARQRDRAGAMIRAIDAALGRLETHSPEPGADHMKELFDGFDPEAHREEAERRWGDTDAFRESQRRASRYGKEDWQRLKAEQVAVYEALAAALGAGLEPTEQGVMDIAERHRLTIDRWFYPCSFEMHEGLAGLYESDPRFAANIDRHGAGLTPFLVAAIRANAARHRAGEGVQGNVRPERHHKRS
jgi:DNA-binding transcriptional MerR regulator